MRFADFAASLEALESTSGRIEMYRLLGELFEKAVPEEVAPVAYLCEGRLLPAFEGVETGMGERGVALALAAATRCASEDIAGASARLGDLGLVAEELIPPTKRPRLSLIEVYEGLLNEGCGTLPDGEYWIASTDDWLSRFAEAGCQVSCTRTSCGCGCVTTSTW